MATDDDNFGLADADFWSDPLQSVDAVAERLWDLDREVIELAAPRRVPIDQRSTLPIGIVRAGTYRELWQLDFHRTAVVAAMNLDHNTLYLSSVQTEELEEPSKPVDLDKAPKGQSTDTATLDLREAMSLPWVPSTYALRVLLRDKVSNTARVELGKSPAAYHDPEVERFVQAQTAEAPSPVVQPTAREPLLPSYRRRQDSPPVPEARGVAINLERVVVKTTSAECILRGAFRLPVLPHERVRPTKRAPGEPAPDFPVRLPTAVVGVTLVVVAGDAPHVASMRLDVPSWDPLVGDTPEVTGHFAIDLMQTPLLGVVPQTYFLYVFSGGVFEGPVPTALIAPESIPRRL